MKPFQQLITWRFIDSPLVIHVSIVTEMVRKEKGCIICYLWFSLPAVTPRLNSESPSSLILRFRLRKRLDSSNDRLCCCDLCFSGSFQIYAKPQKQNMQIAFFDSQLINNCMQILLPVSGWHPDFTFALSYCSGQIYMHSYALAILSCF